MSEQCRTIIPTGTYSLVIPALTNEQYDGRVVSFWQPDDDVLLQISSSIRIDTLPIAASRRLADVIARERLTIITKDVGTSVSCSDWDAAMATDDEGTTWIYGYAVWSDLCIMISISGVALNEYDRVKWAFDAVRSIVRLESNKMGQEEATDVFSE